MGTEGGRENTVKTLILKEKELKLCLLVLKRTLELLREFLTHFLTLSLTTTMRTKGVNFLPMP